MSCNEDVAHAQQYFSHQLSIVQSLGHRYQECNALGNLGTTYFAQGNVVRALQLYKEYLSLAQATEDTFNIAQASWLIGLIYEELGDFEQAVVFQQVYVDFLVAADNVDAPQRAQQVEALRDLPWSFLDVVVQHRFGAQGATTCRRLHGDSQRPQVEKSSTTPLRQSGTNALRYGGVESSLRCMVNKA